MAEPVLNSVCSRRSSYNNPVLSSAPHHTDRRKTGASREVDGLALAAEDHSDAAGDAELGIVKRAAKASRRILTENRGLRDLRGGRRAGCRHGVRAPASVTITGTAPSFFLRTVRQCHSATSTPRTGQFTGRGGRHGGGDSKRRDHCTPNRKGG